MGTPGRDEHQLVRGVPGCSAPALRPSHPGRVLLPSYDSRGRDGFRKRGAHGNAWEGRAPARPRSRGVAHLRYALRTRGGRSYHTTDQRVHRAGARRSQEAGRLPETWRAWDRLGGTSTSSSAECRGVAHLRYALRTRGGCSYQTTIQRVHRAGARRSQEAGLLPETRRAWERLGGTSTSSSADYRGVARRRYALRTRGGCSYKAGGALLLPAGNPPAAVYPRVALEVLVQGLGGDILDLVLLLQCRVQLEAAEVVGEIQHPAGCQTGHGHVQQLHMVALD